MRRTLHVQICSKVFLVFLCLQLAFHAHAQVSGTYTINSTLPTGGTNFQTFTAAIAYMQNGLNGPITFNVAAGTGPYNEQITLDSKIGTTATNTLTFNCNGVTLSFTSNNTLSRAGVKLNGISYVTFDKIRITPQSAGLYGYGFHLLNNSDNNVIKNCRIILPTKPATPGNNEGIVINGDHGAATTAGTSYCDNNLIQNDTISGGRTGITLNSAPASGAAVFMQGNKVLNNIISDSYTNCIELNYNDGTVVDGNDLQGGSHTAASKISGIYMYQFDQNIKVTNNKIHNFHVLASLRLIHGILNSAQAAAGKENLFANNLIYDFSSDYNQYGIAANFATTSYFNIYNNTISLDDQNNYAAECRGLYFSDASYVNVFNNIITISTLTSDYNYVITLEKWMPGLAFKRNVFHVTGCDNVNAVGLLGKQQLKLLSDWQKVTGLDFSSVYIDPQYTNLAAFNFVPKAQPIDNMALYENINTDITGAPRSPLNPDPGCYEFVTGACQTPVIAGGTNVLPDSILCYGPQITLGLTGNSWGVGQSYTFQSATSATGTYTNISSGLAYPSVDLLPATTMYYRAAVTCLGSTMYSAPIRVIVNTRLTAGTYTINSAQPSTGINFNSFGDAVLAMQCGITGSVVFNVAPGSGPYNEQVIIPPVATSPTQTVTFKGNGATVSYAATTNTENSVIKLKGVDYVTIDSLNIKVMGSSFGYGIQLIGDADHNNIQRCSISMSTAATAKGYAGIVLNNSLNDPEDYNTVSYCDSNTITNNTITGGYYGITCTSSCSGAALPSGNILSRNKIIDTYGYGVYLEGVANTLADSNDISQQDRMSFTDFSGVLLKQTNSSVLTPYGNQISRNRVHNLMNKGVVSTGSVAAGIHIIGVGGKSGAPNIVSNNVVYNFRGIAPQYGIISDASNYVKIYHNTISLEDSLGTMGAGIITAGIGFLGVVSTGAEVRNNSVVIKRGGLGTRIGIRIEGNDSALMANNNNYFIKADSGVNYTGSMGGKNYAQLTDWLTVRKDSNSISIYPLYKDSLKADFTPTSIPFDDKGVYVGVTNDISNNTRSITKPDIGANEFTICYPLTEPALTVDSVGGFVVKFSWPAVEHARGYRVSTDGINWTDPSTGPTGTSHYIAGLLGQDTVGLVVVALGTRWDCDSVFSKRVVGKTLSDQIFFPNTFTPNGNGQNDVFKVYSNVIQTMRLLIFNQWGEKVFETNDINGFWDGTYKGKPQPIGVYVYAASLVLTDGTKVVKKGSFNLLR